MSLHRYFTSSIPLDQAGRRPTLSDGSGNILAPQRILGHASLAMTMRYAHLAPDHQEEARPLNPLAVSTIG
jgi:integrase